MGLTGKAGRQKHMTTFPTVFLVQTKEISFDVIIITFVGMDVMILRRNTIKFV